MWILVQVLVFYSCCVFCRNNDIPEVEVHMNQSNGTGGTSCKIDSPKLAFKQMYKLSVKTNIMRNYTGSCTLTKRQTDHEENVPLKKSTKSAYKSKNNIKAVARKLSCSLNEYPENTHPLRCVDLQVNIRDPNMGLKISVSGEEVKPTPASDSESYDAYATYHYKRGELANISCTMDNTNTFRLIYRDKNGNAVDKTRIKVGSVSMLRKMPGDNNGAFIECTTWDVDAIKSYTVRVNLKEKKEIDIYDFGFIVNGLTLSPVQRDADHTIYRYDYFDGEELQIQSFNWNGYNMECKGENIPDNLSSFKTPWVAQEMNITTVLQEYNKTMSITCSTQTSANLKTVTINLIPNYFDYNPFIKGVSMAKVLSKTYTSKLTTIHYNYDEQELYFRCYSKNANPKWGYSSQIENITIIPSSYSSDSNYYITMGTFKLNPGQLSGEINCTSTGLNCTAQSTPCEDNKNITQIVLKRNKLTAPTHPSTSGDNGTPNTSSHNKNESVVPAGTRSFDKKYIYMAAGVGALVIIVIVVCVVMKIARRKPLPDPTAINYENLPKHNEGPMAMPSQWNEAQYSVPSDAYNDSIYAQPGGSRPEDLYSEPVPKNQRTQNEEPGYVTVGGAGPTYAQVLPKSMRGHQNGVQVLPSGVNLATNGKFKTKTDKSSNSKTPSESPYAEMGHNSISYASSSCTENPYADVRFNDNPYAEPYSGTEKSNYSNVFDNARYVNSNSKGDYVEPTYCDLKK